MSDLSAIAQLPHPVDQITRATHSNTATEVVPKHSYELTASSDWPNGRGFATLCKARPASLLPLRLLEPVRQLTGAESRNFRHIKGEMHCRSVGVKQLQVFD